MSRSLPGLAVLGPACEHARRVRTCARSSGANRCASESTSDERSQAGGGGQAARVINAENGLGHVAGHVGMQRAIELAHEYGVGTVFVRDSNHYGASGYWARLALRHNMIGFAFTTATARVAPWGGKEGIVGNNPPAWAVPSRVVEPEAELSAADAESMFLDVALSVVAGNRLDIYRRRQEPIPPGWALDRDGEPTTDPVAANDGGTY